MSERTTEEVLKRLLAMRLLGQELKTLKIEELKKS
jgi:hypothetical protein